jgi:hypothetical protein
MTDWELVSEQIHRAMRSVEDAHKASETLQNELNEQNLDTFRLELKKLYAELSEVQWALEHSGLYSMDEINNFLSKLLSGKKADYRTSTEVESPSSKEENQV